MPRTTALRVSTGFGAFPRVVDAVAGGGVAMSGNDFPKLGINTSELLDHVEVLIGEAEQSKDEMGAVNWGDIGVADIEYRLSMIHPENGPECVVIVEEASPACALERWLNDRINPDQFPRTTVRCEW